MKINNEFTVSAPIEQAWETMLNLERIAPCLPGAAIQEEKGDGEYDGTMKVKIGPITANYKGTVKFEEADEANHRAVLQATGRDARGQGTASATITSTLQEEGDSTKVSVETDMKLTGPRGPVRAGHRPGRGDEDARPVRRVPGGGDHGPPREEAAAAAAEPTGEENGSRDGTQPQAPPAAATGGTAGRIISSEDPSLMAGGTVEGAVVAGAAPEGAPRPPTGQPLRTAGPTPRGAGSFRHRRRELMKRSSRE